MSEGSFQVQPGAAAGAATLEVNEFESLLKKEFKPKSDQARQAVQNAVRPWRRRPCSPPRWFPTMRSRRLRALLQRSIAS